MTRNCFQLHEHLRRVAKFPMLMRKYKFHVDKISNAKLECKTHDIPEQNGQNLYMSSFLDRSKTIPFGTAHTCVAHIR